MKSETEQFNIRLDKKVIEKLQALSDKYLKRSKTQIAVEIIEQYIDLWDDAEAAKRRVIDGQRRAMFISSNKSEHVINSTPGKLPVAKTPKEKLKKTG